MTKYNEKLQNILFYEKTFYRVTIENFPSAQLKLKLKLRVTELMSNTTNDYCAQYFVSSLIRELLSRILI
jgi:hypothetical protein